MFQGLPNDVTWTANSFDCMCWFETGALERLPQVFNYITSALGRPTKSMARHLVLRAVRAVLDIKTTSSGGDSA